MILFCRGRTTGLCRSRITGVWLLVVLLATLAGCQSIPQKPAGGTGQQPYLQKIPRWEAEGKIAIRKGEERESASFKWSQQQENYVIHLFGPFGQGATWLRRTSRSVTLENAKTGVRRATTAEALMQDVMGWQVPVSNLRFWLRGLPAAKPAPTELRRDGTGLLTGLQQQGWQVDYSKYENFSGWWLPTKVVARRDDLLITAVIKSWQLPTAPSRLP